MFLGFHITAAVDLILLVYDVVSVLSLGNQCLREQSSPHLQETIESRRMA